MINFIIDQMNDIFQGPMFLPKCEDQVDPDRIQLPGPRAHNTLEEFELDYSQVGSWEGQEDFLEITPLSSQSCQVLSLQPKSESSSESIVECGITLFNSLDIQKNPRQHSKLALVAKTLGIIFNNMILLFSSGPRQD